MVSKQIPVSVVLMIVANKYCLSCLLQIDIIRTLLHANSKTKLISCAAFYKVCYFFHEDFAFKGELKGHNFGGCNFGSHQVPWFMREKKSRISF